MMALARIKMSYCDELALMVYRSLEPLKELVPENILENILGYVIQVFEHVKIMTDENIEANDTIFALEERFKVLEKNFKGKLDLVAKLRAEIYSLQDELGNQIPEQKLSSSKPNLILEKQTDALSSQFPRSCTKKPGKITANQSNQSNATLINSKSDRPLNFPAVTSPIDNQAHLNSGKHSAPSDHTNELAYPTPAPLESSLFEQNVPSVLASSQQTHVLPTPEPMSDQPITHLPLALPQQDDMPANVNKEQENPDSDSTVSNPGTSPTEQPDQSSGACSSNPQSTSNAAESSIDSNPPPSPSRPPTSSTTSQPIVEKKVHKVHIVGATDCCNLSYHLAAILPPSQFSVTGTALTDAPLSCILEAADCATKKLSKDDYLVIVLGSRFKPEEIRHNIAKVNIFARITNVIISEIANNPWTAAGPRTFQYNLFLKNNLDSTSHFLERNDLPIHTIKANGIYLRESGKKILAQRIKDLILPNMGVSSHFSLPSTSRPQQIPVIRNRSFFRLVRNHLLHS